MNRIFKNFLKCLKACLVGVFWVYQSIFSIVRHLGREPDFWAENRIFKKFLKKPQSMFSWRFLSVSRYFLALFDIWAENQIFLAENRIFKKFLKSLKTCLIGVFWVFQDIFSIVRHLSREPDFLAENRIFKNFLKSLKTCLVGVFWVF